MPHAWLLRLKRTAYAAAALLACLAGPAPGQSTPPLQVVSEELPPYNMTLDGKVSGFSTEVVQAVLRDMGLEPRVQMMPWARAYDLAMHGENVMIYSIARTPDREALFQWAGPIAPTRWFLFSTAARPVHLNNLQQALEQRYQIATVHQDAGEQYLHSRHFEVGQTLQQNNHYALNYQKLKQGHVALWISDDLSATYTVRSLGDNPGQTLYRSLELPEMEHNDVSVAFSLATPEQTVERFRTALRQLRADGRYAAIQRRWVAP